MSPAEKRSREKGASPTRGTMLSGRKMIWDCQLLQMRTRLNLTLRDIESGTGVSNATLSQVERGCDPTLSTAHSIAKFFGSAIEEIWPRRRSIVKDRT